MDKNERRKLLSTAFEPCDGGYLYYRNRWASGVLVSADEREQFISSDAPGAFQLGREFSKRPAATPPRHASPWLIVDALPKGLAGMFIVVALAAATEASRANPILPPWVSWSIGVFMAGVAILLVGREIVKSSDRTGR